MKALLLFVIASALSAQSTMHYLSTGNPFAVWTKCTVTNSSTNLVVSGTGCTSATIAKSAALTQSITLFTLPAAGYVHSFRLKTSTAYAGTTTLKAGLGTASSASFYLVSAVTGYDMKAAVSNTNISTTLVLAEGSDTAASVALVLSLTSTVDNLTSISAGVIDIWVLWSVLP